MAKSCTHLQYIKDVSPRSQGCEECLQSGDTWVSLRLCLTCGHVGCCNNSKNKHAQKHFAETGHPIIQAYGDEDTWQWCYVDKMYLGARPNPLKVMAKIIKRKVAH